MEMGEVADLVDDHRASVTSNLLIRAKHEVVEKELTAPVEEIDRTRALPPGPRST